MAEIYLINISDGLTEEKYQDLLEKVTDERRNKIEKYKFKEDAKRSLYASLLLQYIIFSKYGLSNDSFKVDYNSYGKPYIHKQSSWQFNISHSGEWVICAWDQDEIGSDIEKIEDIDLDIARRFFAPQEYAYLRSSFL